MNAFFFVHKNGFHSIDKKPVIVRSRQIQYSRSPFYNLNIPICENH